MSQTYWKRTLASARESIWVHLKNDMRPDRLRDERSQGETNKTEENAIIRIRIGREYRRRGDVEKKKEREGQFAQNVFGSKSQPNVLENEWSNGESAERYFAVKATRMGEIISFPKMFSLRWDKAKFCTQCAANTRIHTHTSLYLCLCEDSCRPNAFPIPFPKPEAPQFTPLTLTQSLSLNLNSWLPKCPHSTSRMWFW